jgi:hypothetical protein
MARVLRKKVTVPPKDVMRKVGVPAPTKKPLPDTMRKVGTPAPTKKAATPTPKPKATKKPVITPRKRLDVSKMTPAQKAAYYAQQGYDNY